MSYARKSLCLAAAAAVSMLPFSAAFAQDKMKLIMNWTADSAHLGFALAQKNGYYADEGLDVELEEGRGSAVAAQLVATGQADIGYADAGAALNVASQGAPIKIIATIWKAGQFGVQFLDSSGIAEPKDLVGRKLAVAPGSAMLPLVPVFLRANNIPESDVEIVSVAADAYIGLLTSGEVDAVARTPETVLVPLAEQGYDGGNIYFYDNGVPLVSLSLIAREDKLTANPDLYRRFVKATLRGWADAIDDPSASIAALAEVFPETPHSVEAMTQAAGFSFTSVCPVAGQIGVTPPETWDQVYEVMTTAMEFSNDKPISAYYSMDYLPSDAPACK